MKLQQEISYELNQEKVGKTYRTLIDKQEGDYFIGRTEFDSPEVDNEVLIKKTTNTSLKIGDFSMIKINEANDFDLFGIEV
jgi:ribosomal protein S12 methylthiotransferase